jgi:hypothetical protein
MMKTMNKLVSFSLLAFLLAITLIGCGGSTEDTLVGYDWVYPDMDNLMSAWRFSSDGTFNYSTTAFGGMTRTGTWKDAGDSKVELDYNDGGSGELEITSSTTFKVGSTTYNRY